MWIIYSILSAICAAIMSVTIKIGLKDLNPYLSLTIRTLIVFVFCFFLVVFSKTFKEIKTINGKTFIWLVIVSLATFLTWLFYFLAISKSSVTKVMALDKLSIVATVILSVIFLNETITWKIIIGIILLLIGSLLVVFG